MLDPKIIFEDTHLIVLSKPAGLLSQGDSSNDQNLVDWLRAYLGRNYVGLIHRLDRNTSGIMVIAKRTKSAKRLTESLQNKELKRSYLAWVDGCLTQTEHWEHHLTKNPEKNITSVKSTPSPTTKRSSLTANPILSGIYHGTPACLIQFILETGRSHQIRAQSSFQGHPILGDNKYGSKHKTNRRLLLHSFNVQIPHPMSNEILYFESPLDSEMNDIKLKLTEINHFNKIIQFKKLTSTT